MEYTIKKGKHYSKGFNFGVIFAPNFKTYDVKFHSNCWHWKYDIENSGINKLVGYTIGLFIHRNSVRIGWQPSKRPDYINLYLYAYNKGILHKEFVGDVNVDTDITLVIGIYKHSVSIYVDGIASDFELAYKKHYGFKCFPYFGGKSKAPHDMNININ